MKTDTPKTRIPFWIRLFLFLDRFFSFCGRIASAVRDETLLAWLSPEQMDALTAEYYGRNRTYLPDGSVYLGGLFEWERRVLSSGLFPTSGTVLIGAVGGGRELNELCRLGYQVTAFEPSRVLFRAAADVAKSYSGARVVQASYRDLVAAAAGRARALQAVLDGVRYDAVILGWGSFSHIVRVEDRRELLVAIRRIAPEARVLVSFLKIEQPLLGRTERFRLRVRALLGGRVHLDRGKGLIAYLSGGAFLYRFVPGEMESLAAEAGFRVALIDTTSYPHAILVPQKDEERPGL